MRSQKQLTSNRQQLYQLSSVLQRVCTLIPKRARSLSTPRAVDMSSDNPEKIMERIALLTMITSTVLKPFSSMLAKSGSEVRATPRSVIASRHWNKSLVDGWREVTLRRANKIRMMPRDAVMEKRIFTAAIMSIDNSTGGRRYVRLFTTNCSNSLRGALIWLLHKEGLP